MYDVVIIGAGPAGLTAGLYAGRSKLKTLILEKISCGGQILLTEYIENYPGFKEPPLARDLMLDMEKQVKGLGVEILQEEVSGIKKDESGWIVKTDIAERISKSIIISVGSDPKRLGVEGEDLLIGKGVSYCATCDAPLFRGKQVAVIGGGDTAVEEALYLAKFCEKVFLVHRRDTLRAAEILRERVLGNDKITPVWDSVVVKISGKDKVDGMVLKNVKTKKEENIRCSGVFIYVGRAPATGFLADLVKLDEHGHILTDECMQTNKKGIFAAGDCRQKILRQVVTACSDGATAAFCIQRYLESLN
ncbi:MAG: thioredoxin-disulfide reductase [Candidatus Omnitrophica bacterium CG11_big_fil_rev_8_21_14_0_20_42_13]|uniref:Thioredoxin reductase n=1 Tax=Candidatus Ghiorseimicrobium undicola TaxID=1974746 RepID=A0A2H0LV52_9BACT|nr:MAG: thioredoxin-disulfide reductase [Candidatus Omnitrophica bacterium CG11_big_fil_rev_8_21_14_0_20_42_13]